MDTRNVQDLGSGKLRIDLAFIGPLKAAGHYFIEDHGVHRLYQGPINVGYADTLHPTLIDANAYWASVGLSQRFFLMTIGDTQLSLSLMSRGEQLLYAIVGENERTTDGNAVPRLQNAVSYDLSNDPSGGRGTIYLHKAGTWRGKVTALDSSRNALSESDYSHTLDEKLTLRTEGSHFAPHNCYTVITNGWQAWTPEGDVVGSYSLSGGRALAGNFYHTDSHLRVWKREVTCMDGLQKALLHLWYRGQTLIGYEFGLLHFEATS